MTYTPPNRSSHSGAAVPISDQDRTYLARLERIVKPSPSARGRLAALRLRATTDSDQRRVQALTDRWANR